MMGSFIFVFVQSNYIFLEEHTYLRHNCYKDNPMKTLDLDNQNLTSFPTNIKNLEEYTEISIFNNRLTCLPDGIWNLPKLRKLNISCNALTSISDHLGNLQGLSMLDIGHNQITSLPESIGCIPKFRKKSYL